MSGRSSQRSRSTDSPGDSERPSRRGTSSRSWTTPRCRRNRSTPPTSSSGSRPPPRSSASMPAMAQSREANRPRSQAVRSGVVTRRSSIRARSRLANARSPLWQMSLRTRPRPDGRKTETGGDLEVASRREHSDVQPACCPVGHRRVGRYDECERPRSEQEVVANLRRDVHAPQHPSDQSLVDESPEGVPTHPDFSGLLRGERPCDWKGKLGTEEDGYVEPGAVGHVAAAWRKRRPGVGRCPQVPAFLPALLPTRRQACPHFCRLGAKPPGTSADSAARGTRRGWPPRRPPTAAARASGRAPRGWA